LAVIPAALGFVVVNAFFMLLGRAALAARCDWLALTISAWLCFLLAGAIVFLGARFLRAIAFPAAFLIFMIPMPGFLLDGVEIFLQHASAEAAALLFWLTGATFFREGLLFRLPGLTLQVAQECSGVRSTWVLFITSLVAAHWFLRSPWRSAILVVAVLPLAIMRNAFRIFTIAVLTVHVDPRIIDSPLHHRGGPIFFVLSLVPFFALLWWLRRSEQRRDLGVKGRPTPLDNGQSRDNLSR
jgi:exosortase C (VPDSG-CTERM-specific)